jgi:hypothetical protein
MDRKTLSLRLPFDVYRRLVERSRKSINSFVVQAVTEKLEREREEEIAAGLATLAGSVDEQEFALWMKAQRKAMEHIDD